MKEIEKIKEIELFYALKSSVIHMLCYVSVMCRIYTFSTNFWCSIGTTLGLGVLMKTATFRDRTYIQAKYFIYLCICEVETVTTHLQYFNF